MLSLPRDENAEDLQQKLLLCLKRKTDCNVVAATFTFPDDIVLPGLKDAAFDERCEEFGLSLNSLASLETAWGWHADDNYKLLTNNLLRNRKYRPNHQQKPVSEEPVIYGEHCIKWLVTLGCTIVAGEVAL